MRFLTLLLWVWMPSVWAAGVCLEQPSGRLLEYQSRLQPGTCLKNWVTDNPQYGFSQDQIEERTVTASEWLVLRKKWIDDPVKSQQDVEKSKHQVNANKIKAKLGLSDADFEALKDALQ